MVLDVRVSLMWLLVRNWETKIIVNQDLKRILVISFVFKACFSVGFRTKSNILSRN